MILVTGANGFLGPHVVRSLVAAGEGARVRALLFERDAAFEEEFPSVEVALGDLLDDRVVQEAVAGTTAIVHLASKNIDGDGSGFAVNVEGTGKLCAAAVCAGTERFVYMSSVGVYGHGAHRNADESTAVQPDTPLSTSKAAAEAVVLDHHRAGDFCGTVLRHRFVYGEGDGAVVPRLIRAARKYPFWIGGGKATISMVWAQDLAQVVVRFLTAESADAANRDPVYHVTSGEEVTYRQLITILCSAFGYRGPRFSLPLWLLVAPLRLREKAFGLDPERVSGISSLRVKMIAQDNHFSNRRLLARFPDLEFVTFAEGFDRSLSYYRQFADTP